MSTYFFSGIEVSVAVSLVAGIAIGTVMGVAGITSRWLFVTEMAALLIGGAIVVISQVVFAVTAGASLGHKTAFILVLLFVVAEPVVALIAVSTAVAVNYLIRSVSPT